jgi:hypothetical protein
MLQRHKKVGRSCLRTTCSTAPAVCFVKQ